MASSEARPPLPLAEQWPMALIDLVTIRAVLNIADFVDESQQTVLLANPVFISLNNSALAWFATLSAARASAQAQPSQAQDTEALTSAVLAIQHLKDGTDSRFHQVSAFDLRERRRVSGRAVATGMLSAWH